MSHNEDVPLIGKQMGEVCVMLFVCIKIIQFPYKYIPLPIHFTLRGDRGSLGHWVHWDSPNIGNSNKGSAIMKLSNKCQGSPPSFCFMSRRNLYSYKAGEEKLLFRP